MRGTACTGRSEGKRNRARGRGTNVYACNNKSHVDGFVENKGYGSLDGSKQFEYFVNYTIISSKYTATYDVEDITTGDDDLGIDGVAILIDEEVVLSREDADLVFSSAKRNHDVEIIFVQSKTSQSFDLGDFLKFKEGILRFLTQNPYVSDDETLLNARKIFDSIIENVPKIRNGKPSLSARYVATGRYLKPVALEDAMAAGREQIVDLGLFKDVDFRFIDRDELTKLWVSTYTGVSSSLNFFSSAPLPPIFGINEAYLVVVRALDFVENILLSEDGNLQSQVFEENVRAFLGSDNPVNRDIARTLASPEAASRFPVLNNGITIVSPDVQIQGNTLHLSNFQIVNGCQTSNVLYENREKLQDVMVTVKVVETQNEDVFSDLVKATNSQSKVDENQFISLRPLLKRVEQYFNTFKDQDSRIYFERRDRQYVGLGIPALRIFSLHAAAKCVAAMFCNRPELSARYPKTMYQEFSDVIFADNVKEIVFYSSCLTLYRFSLLRSNSTIPQNMNKFKWHILNLVRVIICGNENLLLNSSKVEKSANKIIDVMSHHGAEATDVFLKAVKVCQSMGALSSDQLKRQTTLTDMLAKL